MTAAGRTRRRGAQTGVLKQGARKLRAMRPAQVRREMERPFRLTLIAVDEAERQALGRIFVPRGLPALDEARARRHIGTDGDKPDEKAGLRVATPAALLSSGALTKPGQRAPIAVDPADPEPGLLQLLRQTPEYRLALARTFPVLRELLARELIRAVAGRNAAVAAMSALTEVIPTPLSLILALGEMGSDTVLITANQMSLAFQLAAVRGAEVGWRAQSRALTSIAVAGLGWRTLARELVGLIPAGVGLAAKTAIAYSGTVAVGTALWRVPKENRQSLVMPARSTEAGLASRRQTA